MLQKLGPGQSLADLEPMERLQLCAFDNVASSLRRSTWEQFRYGHRRFGEDVALGKRLIEAGRGILFQAHSQVIHSHNRTPRAEGQRIFCDHQNLHSLFGIHILPDRAALLGNIRWAQEEYGRQVDALDLPADERASLREWAIQYGKWGAYGMYWGANYEAFQAKPRAARMRRIDEALRRGI